MKALMLFVLLVSGFSFFITPNDDMQKEKIKLEAKPDNRYLLKGQKSLYLLVNVQAGKIEAPKNRPMMNIGLVLDRSGSMDGDKIRYAKEACKFVANNLSENDLLSLTIYDDVVEVISEAGKLSNKEVFRQKVDGIFSRNTTNLSGGMLEGYNQTQKLYDRNKVNRIFLLSDGLANRGVTEPEQLNKMAETKNLEHGIGISTFGVGADFNEILMTDLAESGSGNYYFIDSPEKIPEIFSQELKGLLAVVAQNAVLDVEFPEEYLSVGEVYGYKYRTENGKMEVNFKDVISEELKSVLIRFDIKKDIPSDIALKTLLQFDDAETFQRKELAETVTLKPTDDIELYKASKDPNVLQLKSMFEANKEYERVMELVDKGQYREAKEKLEGDLRKMKASMDSLPPSEELAEQYKDMDDYLMKIDEVKELSEREKKMYQKSSRSDNYSKRKRK
ncbi:VWA domain-containing protein [Limibacter armeniacum]|uniref:VWA domain-containing protein n=1 Tax=Limibacter armeniacum TaxID=466084 RepID=UPI002FE51D9E